MTRKKTWRAYTLLETLMTVLLISVLAAVAVSIYAGYRDRAAMMVDETNQDILLAAAKIAAASTGSVAGSLSELTSDQIDRAYAQVTEGKRPYTLLAYCAEAISRLTGSSLAEAAQFLPAQYYNRNLKVITCPKDKTPPTGFDANGRPLGGVSYGINEAVAGKSYAWLLAHPNVEVIIEVDDAGNQEFRHGGGKVSVVTTAAGKKIREEISTRVGRREKRNR